MESAGPTYGALPLRRATQRAFKLRKKSFFATRGVPEHIRSDNGPEFTAKVVRSWLARVRVKTLFIQPGSPWENGYVESFDSKERLEICVCDSA